MRFACWITKATNIHSEFETLFHANNGYMNAPHCYLLCTLPALLFMELRPFHTITMVYLHLSSHIYFTSTNTSPNTL